MIRLIKPANIAQPFSFVGEPEAIYGQTDALALAVVEWLTAFSNSFILPIAAERRFRLMDTLPNIPKYNEPVSVDIIPEIETSEKLGISTAFTSLYSIHLYIQQQVSGAQSEDGRCAMLTALRSQIIARLKALRQGFDLSATAVEPVSKVFLKHYRSGDRGPFYGGGLFDLSRLLELHVYESDTILTFKASV